MNIFHIPILFGNFAKTIKNVNVWCYECKVLRVDSYWLDELRLPHSNLRSRGHVDPTYYLHE